jgi:hypothetical protein
MQSCNADPHHLHSRSIQIQRSVTSRKSAKWLLKGSNSRVSLGFQLGDSILATAIHPPVIEFVGAADTIGSVGFGCSRHAALNDLQKKKVGTGHGMALELQTEGKDRDWKVAADSYGIGVRERLSGRSAITAESASDQEGQSAVGRSEGWAKEEDREQKSGEESLRECGERRARGLG